MTRTPEYGSFDPPSLAELAAMLPRYEFCDFIAQGGMGAVYLARQASLERYVAVKVLPPMPAGEVDYAGHLTREARSMARLTHNNIVAVHDFGTTDSGWFYLVMEHVQGDTLHQAIYQKKLTLPKIRSIALQLCDALIFAHEHGILHRDIKPSNILINNEGRVKVVDFGLAQPLTAENSEIALGTPDYVAPEVLNGERIDHRADLYALGIVVFEMLTGRVPWRDGGKIATALPIGGVWNEVVQKAIHPQPQHRFRDVRELRAAILKATNPKQASWQHDSPTPKKSSRKRNLKPSSSAEKKTTRQLRLPQISLPRRKWLLSALPLLLALSAAGWWLAPRSNQWQNPPPSALENLLTPLTTNHDTTANFANKISLDLEPQNSNRSATTIPIISTGSSAHPAITGQVITELVQDEKLEIDLVPSGHVSQMQEGHQDWISSIALFPDNRRVATASADGTIATWDVVRGTLLMRFGPFDSAIQRVSISRDGKFIAAGSGNQKLRVWDTSTGDFLAEMDVKGRDLTGLTFSADGRWLLLSSTQTGSSLRAWNWQQTKGQAVLDHWTQIVNSLTLMPGGIKDQQHFFTVGGGRDERGLRMELWLGHLQSAAPLTKLKPRPMVPSRVAVSGDGKLAAFTQGSSLQIVEIKTDRDISTCTGHQGMVESIRFLQGGKFLITAAQDRTIRIWETVTGLEVHRFDAKTLCTSHFAVSNDERWLVSGGGMRWGSPIQKDGDYSLHVWRLPALDQIETETAMMMRAKTEIYRWEELDPPLASLRKQWSADRSAANTRTQQALEIATKKQAELDAKYLAALQRDLTSQRGIRRDSYLAEITRLQQKAPLWKNTPPDWPPTLQNLYRIYLEQSATLHVDPQAELQQELQRQLHAAHQLVTNREADGGMNLARAKVLLEETQHHIKTLPKNR